jgi:hypothetical protein
MGAPIANVQTNLSTILATVLQEQPSGEFAVAQYKDVADPAPEFSVLQNVTSNTGAIQTAINALTPLSGGGSDASEDWINALWQIGNGAINFRSDSVDVVPAVILQS